MPYLVKAFFRFARHGRALTGSLKKGSSLASARAGFISQIPFARGGIIEQNDGFFPAKYMDLAVETAQDPGGTYGIRHGEAGFTGITFPKTDDLIDLIFTVFIGTFDLDGQDTAIGFVLTDHFYCFF